MSLTERICAEARDLGFDLAGIAPAYPVPHLTAYHAWLDQGYHGTSMRQIATEAGIAVGGIYNHFASKEAIFETLLERHQPYADIVTGLADLIGDDATELVEGAVRLLIDELMKDPVFIRLVFIDLQEFEGDTLLRFAAQMINGMMAFFGKLVATGRVRQDIPPPVLARSLAGLIGVVNDNDSHACLS